MRMGATRGKGVPEPAAPPRAEDLPRVLCFALSARERASVLRVLRRYGTDRAASLLAALGIDTPREERGRGG